MTGNERPAVPAGKLHLYAVDEWPDGDKQCPACMTAYAYKIDPSDVGTVAFDGRFRGSVCFPGRGSIDYVFVHDPDGDDRDGEGRREPVESVAGGGGDGGRGVGGGV